jgi:high-affinity nickel permease
LTGFDSTMMTNILLACIAVMNVVIMAMIYGRFSKKRLIIVKGNDSKKEN